MRTSRSAFAWLCGIGIALPALFVLSGCPGKLDDKGRFLVDLETPDASDADAGPCGDVPTRIFVKSCGDTGCHGATGAQQGLDLASPGVAARVVGVQAKTCQGTLADPENPEGSLLYTKLATKPACGSQMPLARPALSSADAACVLGWIASQ